MRARSHSLLSTAGQRKVDIKISELYTCAYSLSSLKTTAVKLPMFADNDSLTLPDVPESVLFTEEVVSRMNEKHPVPMILDVTLKPAYKFERPRQSLIQRRNNIVLPKIFIHKGYDIIVSFLAGDGRTVRVNDYDLTVSTKGNFKDLRTAMKRHYNALGESLDIAITPEEIVEKYLVDMLLSC